MGAMFGLPLGDTSLRMVVMMFVLRFGLIQHSLSNEMSAGFLLAGVLFTSNSPRLFMYSKYG